MSDPALPEGFVLDDAPAHAQAPEQAAAAAPQAAPADAPAPAAHDAGPALPDGFVEDKGPALPTQEDTLAHIRTMLDDPKTHFADFKAYYDGLKAQMLPEDIQTYQDRDVYNAAHPGQTKPVGVQAGDPNAKTPDVIDNRPESFEEGARDGVQHILSNAAGAVGFVGNHIGLDNSLGDDARKYFGDMQAREDNKGSTAGKIVGEIAASAPAALIAAPIEAGAAAIGLPAAAAVGLGLLGGGAAQGALATHSNTAGGVARDAAVGAASNLVLGGIAHALPIGPSAATQAGREVLDAGRALSRDGLVVRPAPADVGGPVSRRITGGLNQGVTSGAIIRHRADNYIEALAAAKDRAADALAPAGETAQPLIESASNLLEDNSLAGFRARARADANRDYTAAETMSGDPVISQFHALGPALANKIGDLRGALNSGANPNLRTLEQWQYELATRPLTVSGLRRSVTDLGRQLDSTNPESREIAGALRQALKDDIEAGLRNQGHGQAADLYRDTDAAYRQSRLALDDIRKIVGPDHARYSEEKIAGRIVARIKQNGGDAELIGRVLDHVGPDDAARIRASVVRGLGRAKPANNSSEGTVFSPETYLTHWQDENFSQAAKAHIIPDPQARADLDHVARLAQAAREAGRYRNHSNTAGSLGILNTPSRVASGLLSLGSLGTTVAAEGIGGALASSPLVARGMVAAGEARPFVSKGAALVGARSTPSVAGYLMNLPRPGSDKND